MIRFALLLIMGLLSVQVSAQGTMPVGQPQLPDMDDYLNKEDLPLNKQEWASAKMAYSIMERFEQPTEGATGRIVFTYGASVPSVVCAPMQICTLELQKGETVSSLQVGDSIRWSVTPASGGGTTYIIIKPTDTALKTSLFIATDRRAYYLKLISRKENFMPRIAFEYPEDALKQWQAYYQAAENKKVEEKKKFIPETKEYIPELNFDYAIKGKARWKPIRVYNNGVKTIIQMPESMANNEAPALMVLGENDDQHLVNYRLNGDRYIVDQLFDRAVLIAGVGDSQQRIEIIREGAI